MNVGRLEIGSKRWDTGLITFPNTCFNDHQPMNSNLCLELFHHLETIKNRVINQFSLHRDSLLSSLALECPSPQHRLDFLQKEQEMLGQEIRQFQTKSYYLLKDQLDLLSKVFFGRVVFFPGQENVQLEKALLLGERERLIKELIKMNQAQLPPGRLTALTLDNGGRIPCQQVKWAYANAFQAGRMDAQEEIGLFKRNYPAHALTQTRYTTCLLEKLRMWYSLQLQELPQKINKSVFSSS